MGNGELVVGAVVQLDYDEEMVSHCMGCIVQWRQNLGFSAPPRGQS